MVFDVRQVKAHLLRLNSRSSSFNTTPILALQDVKFVATVLDPEVLGQLELYLRNLELRF